MLTFAEEIYLLALDEKTGKFIIPAKDVVLHNALAASALCELSYLKKIDTDPEYLFLIDSKPTGNTILDYVLEYLFRMQLDKIPIYQCLKIMYPTGKKLEERVAESLVEKKVLKQLNRKLLWISVDQRYPVIDNHEIVDVKTRLGGLIKSDEIPDPREAILISLVHACGLDSRILTPAELKQYRERVKSLAKLELICRDLVEMIRSEKKLK